MGHARADLGLPYGVGTILLNALARVFKVRLSDPIHPRGMFCSQYVAHSFSEGGLDLVPRQPDIVTWPEDILNSKYVHGNYEGTLKSDRNAPPRPKQVQFIRPSWRKRGKAGGHDYSH